MKKKNSVVTIILITILCFLVFNVVATLLHSLLYAVEPLLPSFISKIWGGADCLIPPILAAFLLNLIANALLKNDHDVSMTKFIVGILLIVSSGLFLIYAIIDAFFSEILFRIIMVIGGICYVVQNSHSISQHNSESSDSSH